jgi:hypothetical protein
VAFDWASQKANFAGNLVVKNLGDPGNNAPASSTISLGGHSITFVNVSGRQGLIAETVLVNETTVTLTSAGLVGANAYILPWREDYAVKTVLGSAQDMFVTPQLNGCAIIVSGPVTGPTVVHVNAQPDSISEGMPAYNPNKASSSMAAINKFTVETKYPRWGAVYGSLGMKLGEEGLIPSANIDALVPAVYGSRGGTTSVFGVRSAGNWSFYWNNQKKTTQFWP